MSGEEGPLIAFGKPVELNPLCSDAEFLAGTEWEKRTPAKLLRAVRSGNLEQFVPIAMEAAGGMHGERVGSHPQERARQSLWSRHEVADSPRQATLIRAWDNRGRAVRNRRSGHVSRGRDRSTTVDLPALERWAQMCAEDSHLSPIELLILFEILRDEGTLLPTVTAAKLWRIGLTAAIQRTAADGHTIRSACSDRFLEAELDWQSGLLFAPVAGAQCLATSGRDDLAGVLMQSTDAAGVPSAEIVGELRNWLTTLVRAREWGHRFGRSVLDASQEKRFRALVGAVARLCRGDGRPAFSNGEANGLTSLWTAATASISADRLTTSPAFQYLLSLTSDHPVRSMKARSKNGRSSRGSNGVVRRKRVNPVFQSDSSRLACLRSDWKPDANSLSVMHQGPLPRLELATRGQVMLSGEWQVELRTGGVEVPIAGPWTCSCWYSEEEGDYLELQAQPTPEIRIERQLLLSRTDDLLLVADAVIGSGDVRFDYASRLPLVPELDVLPFSGTRECRVTGPAGQARLFPLGLPCDRVTGSAGQFVGSNGQLELRQSGIGGLYAPIVIDWNPSRRRSPAFWRALTVAQNGTAVLARSASGCRLQIGKEQWLIYRSLSPILEPRTILGQHTMYETMIGRFERSGELEPIVLVEQRTEGAG
jgi:hypothetical protein